MLKENILIHSMSKENIIDTLKNKKQGQEKQDKDMKAQNLFFPCSVLEALLMLSLFAVIFIGFVTMFVEIEFYAHIKNERNNIIQQVSTNTFHHDTIKIDDVTTDITKDGNKISLVFGPFKAESCSSVNALEDSILSKYKIDKISYPTSWTEILEETGRGKMVVQKCIKDDNNASMTFELPN